MGILQAVSDSVKSSLADQWKDIYTAGHFDEHTVVAPGVLKNTNRGFGSNTRARWRHIEWFENFCPRKHSGFCFQPGGYRNGCFDSGELRIP